MKGSEREIWVFPRHPDSKEPSLTWMPALLPPGSEPFLPSTLPSRLHHCHVGIRILLPRHHLDGRKQGVGRVVKLRASLWDLLKPVSHYKQNLSQLQSVEEHLQ